MTHPLYVEGIGIVPIERSFTHRLQPDVDANTVAAFDMSTKNSDGTLMDLSGNSNHGDINGAVRSGGYFTDGMRFDASNQNYVDCGNSTDFDFTNSLHATIITSPISRSNESNGRIFFLKTNAYKFDFSSLEVPRFTAYNIKDYYFHNSDIPIDKKSVIDVVFDGNYDASLYIDGKLSETIEGDAPLNVSNRNFFISSAIFYDGVMDAFNISHTIPKETNIKSRFNSLANLPLYTFNASKYPTSSGWTANVPYSSMSITSGEFSFTDNGQLQCDSAGSFTLRNAHEFDGSEYIKVTIDGVEYAGTETVTEGNVTVAITQGSTLIDVDMGTDDVIDGIDIQFRKPVN